MVVDDILSSYSKCIRYKIIPYIHRYNIEKKSFHMVANFFSNCFQSIKSGRTDFTNLTNSKFQQPFFQTSWFFKAKTHWGVCLIITKNSREKKWSFLVLLHTFLVAIWDCHFLDGTCKLRDSFQPKHIFLLYNHNNMVNQGLFCLFVLVCH